MNETIHRKQLTRATLVITIFCCPIALAAVGHRVDGDEALIAADDAAIVQPFVSETTVLVVKLDPTRIALPELTDYLKSMSPEMQDAVQRWAMQANSGLEWLRATTGGQMVYATVGIPISKTHRPVFVFQKRIPAANVDALRERLQLPDPAQVCVRGEYVVANPVQGADVAQTLDTTPPAPRMELSAAFAAVGRYPLQILLLPPGYVRRTV